MIDGCHDIWKETSTIDDYLMQYLVNLEEQMDKVIVAGHVGTAEMTNAPLFRDICRYKNKISMDSSVNISNKLNFLKIYGHQYMEVCKEDSQWIERILLDKAK